MSRTFVIGDIHGGFRALEQVIAMVEPTIPDRLIFLGDYVDGWSQSFEVVEKLLELQNHHDCIFIKGNHDLWCEQWLEHGTDDYNWLTSGGQATIDSYINRSPAEKLLHLSFYQNLQNYFVDEDNRLFVHAGFASVRGPQNERYPSNYFWDRTLWEMALCLDKTLSQADMIYPKRLKMFNEIYIGHTPTIHIGKFKPVNAANLWNLDTGAAFTGKLSIIEIATKQIWQSDTLQDLYPDEQGRNNQS